ncbi:MAG: glycosyltransferase family 2 protein [Oscillospiraceae bacterium]|nr:glycosyltransferase family 2 protein [Oscillospiraceae bacterium]MDD4369003.1 glycosyltransferase family 2 protein [Oscillospiraceae bacterium]
MRISVIIPFYNEEKQVDLTVDTVLTVLNQKLPEMEKELILIDDGSKDATWTRIQNQALQHPQEIRAFGFARNFGKEAAVCAGLDQCSGDCTVLMDGDLQHPPEYIPEMVRLWREGYEVVDGVKVARQHESWLARTLARTFYKLFHRLSGFDLQNASDFKLLDQKVVAAWRTLGERDTFFRGLSAWLGYRRIALPFEVASRTTGHSHWSLSSLWKLSMSAITGFSSAPLQLITLLGAVFWIFALILIIQTLVTKIIGRADSGFTTVILLQLLIGGAILLALGLVGTYIGKIYDEIKGRPRYLISRHCDQSARPGRDIGAAPAILAAQAAQAAAAKIPPAAPAADDLAGPER